MDQNESEQEKIVNINTVIVEDELDDVLELGEIRDDSISQLDGNEVIIVASKEIEPNCPENSETVSIINEDALLEKDKHQRENCTNVANHNRHNLFPDKLPPNFISVSFSNKTVSDLYKKKFTKFIQTINDLIITHHDESNMLIEHRINLDNQDVIILDNIICCLSDDSQSSKLSKKQKDTKKRKKKKKQTKNQFIVDKHPEFLEPDNILATRYIPKFLLGDKQEENAKISATSNSVFCFNCDGSHPLRDCPHKRNIHKIKSNKDKFLCKNKVQRYHLNDENKYHQLHPGKISNNLRKALGIKDHQVPSYIYKMRREGYPPGWLEEAKLVESDLCMFDSDGNRLKNIKKKDDRGRLDANKLIKYPGFNVPLDERFSDEYRKYSVKPYSALFSIDKMVEYYNQLKQKDNLETQDMDLDSSSDVICFNDLEIISHVKTNEKTKGFVDLEEVPLDDLNLKKNLLLKELQKSNDIEPWAFDTEKTVSDLSPRENDDKTSDAVTDSQNEGTTSEKEDRSCPSPIAINKSDNSIKMTIFGTPILKSASPFNNLPNADNFSKGVSPVINFDNLPNSTGKYEQLFGVLQKVRAQKNMQNK